MSMTPVRVGFTPTFSMMYSPLRRDAAGDQEERRGGNVAGHIDARAAQPLACRASRTRGPSVSICTPKPRSMRSVWSRVGAGSVTVVMPSAYRPASRIADFTCALATGSA